MKTKFFYQCIDCGKIYDPQDVIYVCPSCHMQNKSSLPPRGVLKTLYQYKDIKGRVKNFNELEKQSFIDVLPIINAHSLPFLKIGNTPFYRINSLRGEKLPFSLFLKDDSQNPTFSYKDRASAIVSAYAKEHGLETIVAASTGNAGSSLAGICAAQQQKAIIMVPATAPIAKLIQIVMYGATIIPVKGSYDHAFDLSIKATEELGWYTRNTAFNPLTIEGKKTVSFELFKQMKYRIPDRIFVPVGDGVIISGVYKGFEDLLKLEFIKKMPTIVAVQSAGSDNLTRNIFTQQFEVKSSNTIADSISVDIPRNFYMTKHFIKKYSGEIITITDEEILTASKILSNTTGVFAEPAAAAAFAGMLKYHEKNMLHEHSRNVILLTGSGLKDLKSIRSIIKIPEPIIPTIDNLKKIMP